MIRYTHDAWGNHKVLNGNGVEITDSTHIGNMNVLRYRGYIYDAVSGLYYLNARFYDPETGRFISMDDISYVDVSTYNGLNLYAYCDNNPVTDFEVDGNINWKKLWKAVATVAVVAVCVTAAVVTSGSAIAVGAAFGAAVGTIGGGAVNAIEAAGNGGDISAAFWDGALKGSITGAISGAVAATSLGVKGQVVANTLINSGQYVVEQSIKDESIDLVEVTTQGIIGGIAGWAGGSGATYFKNAMQEQIAKRIVAKYGIDLTKKLFLPIFKGTGAGSLAGLGKSFF